MRPTTGHPGGMERMRPIVAEFIPMRSEGPSLGMPGKSRVLSHGDRSHSVRMTDGRRSATTEPEALRSLAHALADEKAATAARPIGRVGPHAINHSGTHRTHPAAAATSVSILGKIGVAFGSVVPASASDQPWSCDGASLPDSSSKPTWFAIFAAPSGMNGER